MIGFAVAIVAALYMARVLIREADRAASEEPARDRAPQLPAAPAPRAPSAPAPAPPERAPAPAPPPPAVDLTPKPASTAAPALPDPQLASLVDTLTAPVETMADSAEIIAPPPRRSLRAPAPSRAPEATVSAPVGAPALRPDPERLIQTEIVLPAGAGYRLYAVVKLLVGVALFGALLAASLIAFVRGIGLLFQKLAGS